jgi:hypothetical protein
MRPEGWFGGPRSAEGEQAVLVAVRVSDQHAVIVRTELRGTEGQESGHLGLDVAADRRCEIEPPAGSAVPGQQRQATQLILGPPW